MFFSSWMSLIRVVVVGLLAYGALVLVLRVSGKRTLAKLNAFDLVVTVALGSTFATILLSKSVALLEGVLAFVMLALLQFVVAWGSTRSPFMRRVANSDPSALLIDGAMQEPTRLRERITRHEVFAAIRSSGHGDVAAIAAVVLETDGSISVVIPRAKAGDRSAMAADGKTTWFEGLLLVGVYLLLATAFFFVKV